MLPIFYINLATRPDRNEQITQQLAQLNLKAERITAVNGSLLTEQETRFVNQEQFLLNTKRKITNGEIGCAMSHRLIWQKMLDDNLDYALILEDDVVLDKELLTLLNNTSFYQQFDFLNLSSCFPYNPNIDILKSLLNGQKSIKRNADFQQIDWSKHWRIFALYYLSDHIIACECDNAPAAGFGYVLSKKGAKSLLKASDELSVPIDNVWRYADNELKQGFLAVPLITHPFEEDSNISGRNMGKLSFIQKIKRAILKRKSNPRQKDIKKMYYE